MPITNNLAEYDDDTTQIPRSTTVIARRLPAARPGAGRAARYVTGKMPVNAKNAHRIENVGGANPRKGTPTVSAPLNGGKEMTEEERLAAIMSQGQQDWKTEQETSSHKPVVRSYNKSAAVPDKPLPPGYTCHRCGQQGHWIQACPTNNDPNFDGRPKFKRTTGIPRSFLKVVEKPEGAEGEDGKIDMSKLPPGVMYTATGEWVIAEADTATWDKIQEKNRVAAEKAKEVESGNQELRDRGLECAIDKRVFVDPVKTPCCGKTYCRDCIENALLDNDLKCPNCGEQALLDQIEEDSDTAKKIADYEEEKKAEKEQKAKEASKSPKPDTPKDATPKPESPKPEPTMKRKAEDPAPEAPRAPPKAPKADIQAQQAQQQQQAAMMPGMMPGMMPFNPMMGMPMGMNMNMPMMGMGMGMNGMNGMGGMNGMNGFGGGPGMFNGGGSPFQGGMNGGGGMQGNNMQRGPYERTPVNRRGGNRNGRPRSQDFRQV